MSEELSYWCDPNEKLIGVVIRDLTDEDFGWILFARDRIGRFRCCKVEVSIKTQRRATELLKEFIVATLDTDIEALGSQGDEPNEPFDLLRVSPDQDWEKLHPFFKILLEEPARAPARAVLREIGPWLAPSDPHFIKEFQCHQFDQRIWELYLWATFRELGFDVDQPEAPDFLCSAPGIAFTIEATTVGPSLDGAMKDHPNPTNPDEMRQFLDGYMAIKFASPLTKKLLKTDKDGKSYWQRGGATDKPFLLAIADFHKPGGPPDELGSMSYTQSALYPYLYGSRVDWEMVDGQLVIKAQKIHEHQFGNKDPVPSGFFDLPGAENVSAVLFSNAGTLAKFDRMGVVAGFASDKFGYHRYGLRFNPDPNAVIGIPFFNDVADPSYTEYWSDELQIFHNPNAKFKFEKDQFGGVTQHFFENGNHYAYTPFDTVITSQTVILSSN